MTDLLKNPIFLDETKAREWLEARVWPQGPTCPHCGNADQEKITKLEGDAHRPGVYQCNEPQCRLQFTVTVNTVFERSKIPLTKWLAALFLMTASKKGISAHQVHRMLGISYKSTWFMMHRLREAMRVGGLLPPMGEDGGAVEVDETYIGRLQGVKKKRGGAAHKNTVLSLLDRETGHVRSFHVATATVDDVAPIVRANVSKEAHLMTDQAKIYKKLGAEFSRHDTVNHQEDEYVRRDGETVITTNTIESYFSVFKRGMGGTYQHCAEKHLHRYLAEFDFRHNNRTALGVNDTERADQLAKGIVGKRLTYRRPDRKGSTTQA
ncbi:IS1595 family transposase [Bradyrhizobium sp. CIAT3101]|uniref:IS1595 family transposase n=1 Tax=Bradyrhizobium sp. CIAT3101 TaxID=439387 RepID=UPI0024B176A8|nr:IS1595 family transposase [Bradyrhizobium sp. CIAT3101]WFU80943.1 IS1595 family transposase [Bradyrhizobium sp. CIAT3101]